MKNQNSVFDQSELPRTQSGDTPVPGKWEPKLPRNERNAVINIYGSHSTAEAAVEELQKAKFDITKLAIVSREYLDGYRAGGERMKFWAWRGTFWGGLAGLLVSVNLLWVPGVRPLLVGGPLLNVILCVIQGAVVGGGLSALLAGLMPRATLFVLGISSANLLKHQTAFRTGKCLLIKRGTEEEAAEARKIVSANTEAHGVRHQNRKGNITMNDTDTHPLFAPVRTAAEIPEPTPTSRKRVIAFKPEREIAVPVAHLHHPHNDPSVRPDACPPGEVLLAATTSTHHRQWGINE